MDSRSAGVLMNITSLPGPYGVGCFGPEAKGWVDTLADMGFRQWQVLPLGPLDSAGSPYAGNSAFAGNELYIDPRALLEQGLVTEGEEAACRYGGSPYTADYAHARETREALLRQAFSRRTSVIQEADAAFASANAWAADYALYRALKKRFGGRPWWEWPEPYAHYPTAVTAAEDAAVKEDAACTLFAQRLFFEQWAELKAYAHEKGVRIIGDMPIYLSRDSADVWSRLSLFRIDPVTLSPDKVAGVPPDYFSAEGQLWGNPLYDWEAMEADGYAWWIDRIDAALTLYDTVRIDHFRAFASYWAVPAGASSAREGAWEKGPGVRLFDAVKRRLGSPSILAEDLGVFGEDVVELLEQTGFPGMRVVQFGFDPTSDSIHLPHHYPFDTVAYVGTHDNNTLLGYLWEATPEERAFALRYCGFEGDGWGEGGYSSPACRRIIETVWRSSARLAVVAFQDMCGFGSDARMNIPGVPESNWRFRTTGETIEGIDRPYFREINRLFRR